MTDLERGLALAGALEHLDKIAALTRHNLARPDAPVAQRIRQHVADAIRDLSLLVEASA